MSVYADLTGNKYGMLIVLSRNGSDKRGRPMWLCECECGNTKAINGANIKRQFSCGCVRVGMRTHNCSRYRAYGIWLHMVARCNDPDEKGYHNYGGRGIKVCERWQDVTKFVEDMGEPPDRYSIERIDVNRDYSPDNCKWIPLSHQNRNKRNSMFFEGLPVREVALKYNLTEDVVRGRIYKNIPMEQIPKKENLIMHGGLVMNQKQWAAKLGVCQGTVSYRIRRGRNPEGGVISIT